MARVIKSGATVIARGLAEAKAEAETLSSRARAEAAAAIDAARAEASAIRQAAYAEGLAAARLEAASTLLDAARAKDALLGHAERDVVEVALAAAARIVEAHVSVGPEQVQALVRSTLERARRAKRVVLALHPDDAALLAGATQPLPPNVHLEPDATLSRGDCVVRSELGTIDARVVVKLEAVRAALLGAR